MILGNGRTGSTWLLTSLDRLPNVLARQEIKWLPDPSFALDPDVHSTMSRERSAGAALEDIRARFGAGEQIVGSKLVLNPFCFYGPGVFENLRKSIEDNVRPVLLRRFYLDTWLSWKVRGVYHELNPDIAVEPTNRLVSAIGRLEKPDELDLVLCLNGHPLSCRSGRFYDFLDFVDDMLQFFVNDMQLLQLVQARDGFVVDYDDVPARLQEIADFIGERTSRARIKRVLAQPQTLKLPELQRHLAPIDVAMRLSDALDRAFSKCAQGVACVADILAWQDSRHFTISDTLIAGVLRSAGLDIDSKGLLWSIRKPLIAE